jgi:hypothetical protein
VGCLVAISRRADMVKRLVAIVAPAEVVAAAGGDQPLPARNATFQMRMSSRVSKRPEFGSSLFDDSRRRSYISP